MPQSTNQSSKAHSDYKTVKEASEDMLIGLRNTPRDSQTDSAEAIQDFTRTLLGVTKNLTHQEVMGISRYLRDHTRCVNSGVKGELLLQIFKVKANQNMTEDEWDDCCKSFMGNLGVLYRSTKPPTELTKEIMCSVMECTEECLNVTRRV